MKAFEKKHKRAESTALQQQADRGAKHNPIVVSGIGAGELITVAPAMFKLLDVDATYQRGETTMVNQIIRALQSGGKVLDPVTLCQRKGSDTMWVVDGHQRVCAFQAMKMPFQAMFHRSEGVESERQFFVALNSKNAVSANVVVKAWTGPSGALIRRSNENPEHPLYDRVNLTQASNDARIGAASLARAMLNMTGAFRSGQIARIMSTIDTAMSKSMYKVRVEHFLRLIGLICPKGTLPSMVLRGLAVVALERWQKDTPMPTKAVIERLRIKQWQAETILSEKYFPVLLEVIRKAWKA